MRRRTEAECGRGVSAGAGAANCRMMLMKLNTQKLSGMSTESTGHSSAKRATMSEEVVLLGAFVPANAAFIYLPKLRNKQANTRWRMGGA